MKNGAAMQHTHISDAERANLGPGCYVQVSNNNHDFWIEIIRRDDDQLTGKIHRELNGNPPPGCKKFTCVGVSAVSQLGCDNYCFC